MGRAGGGARHWAPRPPVCPSHAAVPSPAPTEGPLAGEGSCLSALPHIGMQAHGHTVASWLQRPHPRLVPVGGDHPARGNLAHGTTARRSRQYVVWWPRSPAMLGLCRKPRLPPAIPLLDRAIPSRGEPTVAWPAPPSCVRPWSGGDGSTGVCCCHRLPGLVGRAVSARCMAPAGRSPRRAGYAAGGIRRESALAGSGASRLPAGSAGSAAHRRHPS